jgi:hypothetical protein
MPRILTDFDGLQRITRDLREGEPTMVPGDDIRFRAVWTDSNHMMHLEVFLTRKQAKRLADTDLQAKYRKYQGR